MAVRDNYSRKQSDYEIARGLRRTERPPQAGSGDVLTILWRRKLVILGCLVLAVGCGIAYIVLTPSRYLASTAMLIDPRLGKTVGSDPVQPGFIVDTSAMDSQIKLFTSQTVLARVAKMTDLKDDSEFNGSRRSLLQRLLRTPPSLDEGVDLKALEKAITIKRPERTYVVTIEVLARQADKAAEIANAVTEAYIADQVSSRVVAATDDTQFVRQRLDKLSTQIKDAETKVEAFKTKNNIVDSAGLRSNEQQVSDLTKALGDARSKMSDTQARLEEIKRLAHSGRLDSSIEAVKSQTMERLRQQQAETEQSTAKLAMTLGPHHPALEEARGRQRKIEGLIRDELQRIGISASSDYQAARLHASQIEAELNRVKKESTDLSRNLVPLEQLERNVKVLRASFDRFAQISDNLSQQESDSPPGRVIAVARPPVSPSQPKKTVIGIVSLSAGLFFGLAAALFMEGAGRDPAGEPLYEVPAEPAKPRQPARAPARRRYWDDQDDDVHA